MERDRFKITMDKFLKDLLKQEESRQYSYHNFIASENFASDEVLKLCGSSFANKYAEGYPGKRYYNGCSSYDELEDYAINAARKLFQSRFANVQPHSGANANLAVFKAFLKPGDTVLGMDLSAGGHLSHGSKANVSGKWFDAHFYGVDESGLLDYDQIRAQANKVKPKMIIAGASAYPRQIHWLRFRQIADEVGALLLCDMSHYSGLIAAKQYINPVPFADVVTSTTHKTLRSARGGIILWNIEEYSKRINSAVFPGTQGGPLMNMIAGKAQGFIEADTEEFREYGRNVYLNAREMVNVFKEFDIKVVTGGTDSHIILLETGEKSGREVADTLESDHNIIVNKNSIPNDRRSVVETSGIRLGTAAMTTVQGGNLPYFRTIASIISETILA